MSLSTSAVLGTFDLRKQTNSRGVYYVLLIYVVKNAD